MDEQDLKQTVKAADAKQAPELIAPDDKDPLVGTVLSERHKILSQIGSGGMGTVYMAEHLLLNKMQAIKVLHRHLTGEAQNLERFKTEAKAASNLRHENLIAVTEYGVTEDKQPYIVMDYVEGESLAEMLKRQGKLSFHQFVDLFSQICSGLAQAHAQGVVHRDLKPSNIMISRNPDGAKKARILDFGIAKILDNEEGAAQHLTQTGEIFGSPLYMSPEQCKGGKIDRRSDIYSLGCVMFEALTGDVPVKGPSAVETLYKHISGDVPTISSAHPEVGIPTDLEKIVAKALANDPGQRYDSAAALAEDLGKANLEMRSSQGQEKKAKSIKSPGSQKSKARSLPLLVLQCAILVGGLAWFTTLIPANSPAPKAQAPTSVSTPSPAQTDEAKTQLQLAQTDFDAATGNNGAQASIDYAKQALAIRQKWAPNSPALAQSLDQVAHFETAIEYADEDAKVTAQKKERAEDYYLKAIAMVPNDKPYLLESGKQLYMRDLARLYMSESKYDQASSLLEEVRQGVGKSVADLDEKDDGESKLLRDFADLYWGEKNYVDSATIEVRLAVPTARLEDLSVKPNPSFAGDWTMVTNDGGYSVTLALKNAGHRKLKGNVSGSNPDASRVDGDDEATGTYDGPVAEVSWTAYGGQAKAKIVRVGDYMFWKIVDSTSTDGVVPSYCADTAVLKQAEK